VQGFPNVEEDYQWSKLSQILVQDFEQGKNEPAATDSQLIDSGDGRQRARAPPRKTSQSAAFAGGFQGLST